MTQDAPLAPVDSPEPDLLSARQNFVTHWTILGCQIEILVDGDKVYVNGDLVETQ